MNNKAVKIVFEVMYEDRSSTGYVEIPAIFIPHRRNLLFRNRREKLSRAYSTKIKVGCHICTGYIDDDLVEIVECEKEDFLEAFSAYVDIYKNIMYPNARIVPQWADEVEIGVKAQDNVDHKWYPLNEIFVIDGDVIPIYDEMI